MPLIDLYAVNLHAVNLFAAYFHELVRVNHPTQHGKPPGGGAPIGGQGSEDVKGDGDTG